MKLRDLTLLAGAAACLGALPFSALGKTDSEFRTPRYGIELKVHSEATEQEYEVAIVILNRTTGDAVARPVLKLVSTERENVRAVDPESGVEYLVHVEIGDHGRMIQYGVEIREPGGTVSRFESLVPLDG